VTVFFQREGDILKQRGAAESKGEFFCVNHENPSIKCVFFDYHKRKLAILQVFSFSDPACSGFQSHNGSGGKPLLVTKFKKLSMDNFIQKLTIAANCTKTNVAISGMLC
jgi:hypothetical protein